MFRRNLSGNRRISSQRRISFMELEQKVLVKDPMPTVSAQAQPNNLYKPHASSK